MSGARKRSGGGSGEPVPLYRVSLLLFAVVAVATLAAIVLALFIALPFAGEDASPPGWLGLFLLPLPALGAVLAFLLVTREAEGRRLLAVTALFFGGVASTIFFLPIPGFGVALAPVATAGFALVARRLLLEE